MNAEFTPNKNTLKHVDTFRHWCQKVLPLVYDDSLSYYELLCKVTNYLNETISNVDMVGEDIGNLYNAYTQLQGYVNDYFTELDVQEEIDVKLDNMAKSGDLDVILRPLFNEYDAQIKVLDSRVTNLASLESGSTTGDAELVDARVDYNGNTWDSVGDHVRGVTGQLSSEIEDKTNMLGLKNYFNSSELSNGYYHKGNLIETNEWKHTDYIPCNYLDNVYLAICNGVNLCAVTLFDENKNYLGDVKGDTVLAPYTFTIQNKRAKYVIYNVITPAVLSYDEQYFYIKDNTEIVNAYNSLQSNTITVDKNAVETGNVFNKFVDGFNKAIQTANSTLIVKSGVYDLLEELGGSEYTENYDASINDTGTETNTLIGLRVTNPITIIAESGAILQAFYEGANKDFGYNFSALNIFNSATIIGLTIQVKNVRYCVHEDVDNAKYPYSYKTVYDKCNFYHLSKNEYSYDSSICIGGGGHKNSFTELKNCRFESANGFYYPVTFHNMYGDYPYHLYAHNNVFVADQTIRLTGMVQTGSKLSATISNNLLGREVFVNGTTDRIDLCAFNNEIIS